MFDSEMTWDVDKSVADVWLAVHHAVFDAVNEAVYRAVFEAVCWVAVNRAAQDDADHPAPQDFLKGVET